MKIKLKQPVPAGLYTMAGGRIRQKRYSRQLRHVIFQFVEDEYRVGAQTLFMPEFLAGTQELFDVLDMIDDAGTER
ncbi:MAG: hypothetical protein WDO19_03265 [Bacteroidota bacterium]